MSGKNIIKQLEDYTKFEKLRQAKIRLTDPIYTLADESIFECTDEELKHYKTLWKAKNEN